ncbi:MAG: endonuclease [Thermoplasmata archaeon HGW-Thermoplasmata-2]|nr:MAG: endonuclease [Thermoplasmata archaeon HGW-Thermoplasmata-2]
MGYELLLALCAGFILGIIFVYFVFVKPLRRKVADLISRKQSLSTTYGKITEQFAPFMAHYPYNPQNFRFLGTPIDGVQFNESEVVFVEIKSSKSKPSALQNRIRSLVEQGRVRWMEFRIG